MDTGHIGIHGGMDVRTFVRTVDDVMAIKPKFLACSARAPKVRAELRYNQAMSNIKTILMYW